MIKAVLFDLDGTLLDTIDVFWNAFNKGVEMYQLHPVPRERIMALMNRGERLHAVMNEVYPGLDVDEKSPVFAAMVADIRQRFASGGVKLMDGARELLDAVKAKGLRLGVVTSRSTPYDKIMKELQDFGIEGYFDVVITSAGARRKPAPDTVVKCVDDLGVECGDCVIIGDSNADVVAGKAAGMRTVAVADGVAYQHELIADAPDFLFANLADLAASLDWVLECVNGGEPA